MPQWSPRGAFRLNAVSQIGQGLGDFINEYLKAQVQKRTEKEVGSLLTDLTAPQYGPFAGGYGQGEVNPFAPQHTEKLYSLQRKDPNAYTLLQQQQQMNTTKPLVVGPEETVFGYNQGKLSPLGYGQPKTFAERAVPTPPAPRKYKADDGYYHESYFDTASGNWKDRKTQERWPVTDKDGGKAGGPKPTSADAKFLSDYAVLEKDLTEVQKSFKSDWVGPIVGRWQEVQSSANKLPKEQERFRAQVAGIRNKFLNVLSGAAISPAESERLMQQLPTVTDSPTAFQEKVGLTLENVKFLQKKYQESRSQGSVNLIDRLMDKPAAEMTDEEMDAFINEAGQ